MQETDVPQFHGETMQMTDYPRVTMQNTDLPPVLWRRCKKTILPQLPGETTQKTN
jgi:hypothetical protein